MEFKASDTYSYFRPSKCGLRVYLRHRGVAEVPPGPLDRVLRRLGLEHERRHLETLPGVVDLGGLNGEEAERRTLEEIRAGAPAIYQARFRAAVLLDGESCEIVGHPDFLLRRNRSYAIRDSKLARSAGPVHHQEICLQLQIYGWLYERAVGAPAEALEVHAGDGQIVPVAFDGGGAALGFLRFLASLRNAPEEFYEPVGWSKCGGCGYASRCWSRAEASGDAAILPGVSEALARKLRARGLTSLADLPAAVGDPAFRDLFKPGGSTSSLLRSVEAHTSGEAVPIAPPALPAARSFAMLDLEGMPAFSDELERIYLWGLKVFGEGPSPHLAAVAGPGESGDRQGWLEFLRLARGLIEKHGAIPFVHWGSYEKTKLSMYAKRFGDPDGTGAQVSENLVDLLRVTQDSVALPLPSYGLKTVEKHVGFRRVLPDANGQWAMARYIEAMETGDVAARAAVLAEIRAYNEEDLDATRAVMEWLRGWPRLYIQGSSALGP